MKEPRTFQIVLLVVFGLLALAGLLFFANAGGFANKGQQVGEVLIWGTLPADAVNAGLSELTAGSDTYGAVSYEEMSEATWRTDLSDALAAGTGPDLIIISQEDLASQMDKLALIPYETYPERTYVDTFVPLFELFLSDEGSYGIPLVVDPLVLYYNRTILSTAKVAKPPTTWEAVAGMAPQLSRRDDASVLSRSAIPFGEYQNVRNARAILSLLMLQAGTPITEKDSRGAILASFFPEGEDSPFGRSAAESAIEYFVQFGDPAKTVYSWNRSLPDSRDAFLAGDLALYPGYASELPYLQNANPNLDFDMTRIPEPKSSKARVVYGKGYALAVPKTAFNAYGATQVALALSEAKPVGAIATSLSVAPARRELLSGGESDRYAAIYMTEALSVKGWLSPTPPTTDAIFGAMIGNITSGRLSTDSALTAAAAALDTALR